MIGNTLNNKIFGYSLRFLLSILVLISIFICIIIISSFYTKEADKKYISKKSVSNSFERESNSIVCKIVEKMLSDQSQSTISAKINSFRIDISKNIDIEKSTVIATREAIVTNKSKAPILEGEIFQTYLYDKDTTNSFGGEFELLYQSETCLDIALQLLIFYDKEGDNVQEAQTFISDVGGLLGGSGTNIAKEHTDSENIGNNWFKCKTNPIYMAVYPNARFLFVKPYGNQTIIAVRSTNKRNKLPPQGRNIKITISSKDEESKKFELFDNFPIFPQYFLTTEF